MSQLLLLTALTATAPAQEVKLLWSDAHNEVLDKQSATIVTPVATPANAIDWQYSIGESQRAFYDVYPKDRPVIKPIEVVRDRNVAELEPKTMEIDGRPVVIKEEL